ncbi:MAG: DNA-deoxyinosine glycosylase [Lachnospiraceae bacterium]|nr:DNA-deoxyinosine glycosylase [Lachnospiraceae bacterium]
MLREKKGEETVKRLRVQHSFEPVYDEHSEILILGSFPSVKSREIQFYYGHPQNRFWKLIAALTEEETPQTTEEKKALLYRHHIALWDVVQSCEIIGSSDSSIRDVTPADLNRILRTSPIRKIFANGDKAFQLYRKYCQESTGRTIERLPSTSPANAAFSLEKLIQLWRECLFAEEDRKGSLN